MSYRVKVPHPFRSPFKLLLLPADAAPGLNQRESGRTRTPSPVQAARYVELMGGATALIEKSQQAYDAGDYRWAAQTLQHLVLAEPQNEAARYLQADAFEQLGYQAEAATWRNIYFAGAQELRQGLPKVDVGFASSPDLLKALPLEMGFDFLGIQLDVDKAADKTLTINFEVDGTGEKRSLTLPNRVVNHLPKPGDSPDVTVRGTSAAIVELLMGGKPADLIASGAIKTGRPRCGPHRVARHDDRAGVPDRHAAGMERLRTRDELHAVIGNASTHINEHWRVRLASEAENCVETV